VKRREFVKIYNPHHKSRHTSAAKRFLQVWELSKVDVFKRTIKGFSHTSFCNCKVWGKKAKLTKLLHSFLYKEGEMHVPKKE
jgi:hypothetical protein